MPRREIQFDAVLRPKTLESELAQTLRRGNCALDDLAHLFFHRDTMIRGLASQKLIDFVVDPALALLWRRFRDWRHVSLELGAVLSAPLLKKTFWREREASVIDLQHLCRLANHLHWVRYDWTTFLRRLHESALIPSAGRAYREDGNLERTWQ